ncbi:MAG: hypothetical protein N3G75_06800 [Methanothrix sp.]|nr:hypothetical protein [Methanothrix sp.]MCX8207525.1 hypothetical protein [Methanothrix sp.]
MITHKAIIGGRDVSGDLISVHAEQALGMNSDPAKIDILLSNFGNRYTGAFLPRQDQVNIVIYNVYMTCGQALATEAWTVIMRGQIQKVSYASDKVKIEATCQLGTLSDAYDQEFEKHYATIKEIVEEIPGHHLDPPRQIKVGPLKANPTKQQQIHRGDRTFLDSLDQHAIEATAVYYTDPQSGQIVFRHPESTGDAIDVDGYVMHQEDADNAVGRRNVVYVIGADKRLPADTPGSEIESHQIVMGKAEDSESIAKFGRLVAPIVFRPYLTSDKDCETVAKNLLAYYSSFEDVARIKIFGKAPYPLQTVLYAIRSNVKGPGCDGRYVSSATTSAIDRVIRRVIDYSKDGFYCIVEGPTKPSGGFQSLPSQEGGGQRMEDPTHTFWWLEGQDIAFAKMSWFNEQMEMRMLDIRDFAPGGKFYLIGRQYGSGFTQGFDQFRVIRQSDEVPKGWKIIYPWFDESITSPEELVKIETWQSHGLV